MAGRKRAGIALDLRKADVASAQPASRLKTFSSAENIASYTRCQEVRISLESDAARFAALRRNNEQMTIIDVAHARFAQSATQGTMNAEEDLAFHTSITEATGNEFSATCWRAPTRHSQDSCDYRSA